VNSNEVGFIPFFYNIKWSRNLNELLSKYFYCPYYNKNEKTYLPGKSQQSDYMSKSISDFRSKGIEKIIFSDFLECFDLTWIRSTSVKEIFGIIHSLNFINADIPGAEKKYQEYEKTISAFANKLFCATDFVKDNLPYKNVESIGLPIFNERKQTSTSDKIIWNHRLSRDKNPLKLFELNSDIKNKLIISSPINNSSTNYIKKIKEEFKNFIFNPSEEEYYNILNDVGFGISFNEYETFGYSVLESIQNGIMYFVQRKKTTCSSEIIIDELLFNEIDELQEKISFFSKEENFNKRIEIVNKQQEKINKYYFKNWIKVLSEKISVDLIENKKGDIFDL